MIYYNDLKKKQIMYNIYKHQQISRVYKQNRQCQEKYVQRMTFRKHQHDQMSKKYKKKVQTFLITMMEHPISILNHTQSMKTHCFRDEDISKVKGAPNFYYRGFKHEKDRIKESIQKNKELDLSPNCNISNYQFRTRDIEKERQIHPNTLRFKANTSLERVEEFLQKNVQAQLKNIDYNKKIRVTRDVSNDSNKKNYFARQIAKNLLPQLHSKTHFNALTTMSNRLPISSLEQQIRLSKDDLETSEELIQSKKNIPGNFENFDMAETSRGVLLNCNYRREKNPKIGQTHKKEGHLICAIDETVGDVYSKIQRWLSKEH